MEIRRARHSSAALPLSAMVDVVFLLLIFFMCATKFRLPEGALETHLPRASGWDRGTAPVRPDCRVVLRAATGETVVFCDEVRIPPGARGAFEVARGLRGPDTAEIEGHLRARVENDPAVPVVIDFGADVPWKYVVDVLNVCKRLRVTDVRFAAPAEEVR